MDPVVTTYTDRAAFLQSLDFLGTFWTDGAKDGNGYNPAAWYMANLNLLAIRGRTI